MLHKERVKLLDTTDQVSYKSKKKRDFVGRGRRRRHINTLTRYCNHLQKGHHTTCKLPLLTLPRVVTQLPQRHTYSRFKDRISKSGSSLLLPEFAGDSCPKKRDSQFDVCLSVHHSISVEKKTNYRHPSLYAISLYAFSL